MRCAGGLTTNEIRCRERGKEREHGCIVLEHWFCIPHAAIMHFDHFVKVETNVMQFPKQAVLCA